MALLPVVLGTGAEAHQPSVGQFAGKGHAATASGYVSQGTDIGATEHIAHESVCGAIASAVGKYYGRFLPAHRGAWLKVFWREVGEIGMSRTCLVRAVTRQYALVGKMRCKPLGVVQLPAAIATDIYYQARAEAQMVQHLGNVALAYCRRETLVHDVSHIVIQDTVVETRGYTIVRTEVGFHDFIVEVGGIILFPCPVASHVGCSVEVDMSVAQLGKHVAKYLLQLGGTHVLVQLSTIPCMHLVPIQAYGLCLIIQETIVLVDNLPKGFHIALGGIVELHLIDTRGKRQG